jgi:hypothetical protein
MQKALQGITLNWINRDSQFSKDSLKIILISDYSYIAYEPCRLTDTLDYTLIHPGEDDAPTKLSRIPTTDLKTWRITFHKTVVIWPM